mmetsp:Transcript_31302/g.52860  ORF Transcript_31302/g.52860 Transcript_31302/m.52860 type:complete len:107 (-) Transcript_31302:899-1219(-)
MTLTPSSPPWTNCRRRSWLWASRCTVSRGLKVLLDLVVQVLVVQALVPVLGLVRNQMMTSSMLISARTKNEWEVRDLWFVLVCGQLQETLQNAHVKKPGGSVDTLS